MVLSILTFKAGKMKIKYAELIVCGSETKKDNKYEAKSRNICRNVKHVKLQNM